MSPQVTVAIPAYNHEAFVEQSVESVLAQTGARFELKVVDDGSKDRTRQKLERLAAQHPQLDVWSRPNRGIAATLNDAIGRGCAPYVAILASDDFMLPGRLAAQLEVLERTGADVVHTDFTRVDEQGRALGFGLGGVTPARGVPFDDFLFGRVGLCAPTVMFRRSVFDAVGGFDPSYPIEDWPFYLRAARRGFRFEFIAKPLTAWRDTGGSAGRRTARHWKAGLAIWEGELRHVDAATARRARTRFFRYELQSAVYQRDWATVVELALQGRELLGPGLVRWATATAARATAQGVVPAPVKQWLRAVRNRRQA